MKDHKSRPGFRPVQRVEVSDRHFPLRVVLLAMSVVLAAFGLGYGIYHLINTDPGWQTVEVSTSERNVSQEFTLQYYFGASGMSASAENKMLNVLYTDLMEESYVRFSDDEPSDTMHNMAYVNDHLNEEITVDPVLYEALSLVQQYKSRYLYLAPVHAEYERMFFMENADEARPYDPAQNPEQAEYVQALASFGADPAHIDLELLGKDTLILHVSEEYLCLAEELEIETFISFSWMKNAFIVDHVAEKMAEQNLTLGYIASYDGFTRNLDGSGNAYSQNVFDRLENDIYLPARLQYTGPMSLVSLRNYPMTDLDRWHYFSFGDSITSLYVDPADGMTRSSTDNLLACSQTASCAEILLQTAPVFIAQTLDQSALEALQAQGIHSIWGEKQTLYYTEPSLQLTPNAENQVPYELICIQ